MINRHDITKWLINAITKIHDIMKKKKFLLTFFT